VNWLENEEYEFHCYQIKEDRPYRVRVKGLHQSTLYYQVKEELEKIGHKWIDIHTPLSRNETGTSKASPVNMSLRNIKAAARLATPSPVERPTSSKIPITTEILLLIAEKRRLHKRWVRSRHPLDKADWNRAKYVLHRALVEHKSVWFDDTGNEYYATHSLWNATPAIKRRCARKPPLADNSD